MRPLHVQPIETMWFLAWKIQKILNPENITSKNSYSENITLNLHLNLLAIIDISENANTSYIPVDGRRFHAEPGQVQLPSEKMSASSQETKSPD